MQLRWADAVNPPSLISWTRVPLAATFPFVVDRPALALAVLFAAAASDVFDGWLARRTGSVTAAGSVIDPITDKIFVLTVVTSLVVTGRLTLGAVLWLSTREIGEAPLVAWALVSARIRHVRVETPMANVTGKIATVLQFTTVMLAIVGSSWTSALVRVTAVAGAAAAIHYAARAIAGHRRVSGSR